MKFWTSQAFVNQIWRRSIWILLITQIIFMTAFFLLSATQFGKRVGESLFVLVQIVDVIYNQADPVLISQVTDILHKDIFYQLISGRVENTTDRLPAHPILRVAAKTLDKLWQGKLSIRYQADPVPMLWAQKNAPPLFALGIPFFGYKFLLNFIGLVLIIFFLVAIFMAWWIAKRISIPLLRLAEDAVQMGSDQKIEFITPEARSCTEVVVLAEALNGMRKDIITMIHEREDFLAEISHDLRTPLSRLSVAVEILDPDSSPFIANMRADIEEMGDILRQTIELACSTIDSNEAWVQGDINHLLSAVQSKYQRAGVSLQVDLATMPKVRFKALALTRLLYNLVDNGLQHDSKGQVTLVSRLDSGIPAIVVVNTGTNDRAKVMSASIQPITVSHSNGLGLLIVQRVADLHGATVTSNETPCKDGREVVISFTGHLTGVSRDL
jgi:signal transduction histidine kinase